ncbi:MAG: hypothetical protein Q8876_03120 [Bacillota bacterium]|nr:hypothetical protein [Bacillota bacterium]
MDENKNLDESVTETDQEIADFEPIDSQMNETDLQNSEEEDFEELPKHDYVSYIANPYELESEDEEEIKEEKVKKPRKKRLLNNCIIISICIFVCTGIALFFMYAFFDNSCIGTWKCEISGGKGAYYYTFKDNGVLEVTVGSVVQYGSYVVSSDKSTITCTMGQDSTTGEANTETPSISITGNVFTGKKMKLTFAATQSTQATSLDLTKSDEVIAKPSVDKKFKQDTKLVGAWTYSDTGISTRLMLNSDGTCKLDENGQISYYGAYTLEKGSIKINIIAYDQTSGSIKEMAFGTLTYKLDTTKGRDNLVINGIGFKKEK